MRSISMIRSFLFCTWTCSVYAMSAPVPAFPSIPVKILYPQLEVTILEPLAKRIRFLEELCAQLSLTGVHCLHVRAEDHAKEHRECFDVVSARAVAALPVLSELCLPLVQGRRTVHRHEGTRCERRRSKRRSTPSSVLGAEMEKREESRLSDGAVRINVFYRKQRPTDRRYPRNFGQIKKHPL